METTQVILDMVTKQTTDIFGLKWVPSLEPTLSNDSDWPITHNYPGGHPQQGIMHFSSLNHEVLLYALTKLSKEPSLIVEIGVDRSENYGASSTATLLKTKPVDCMYIGIDIEDKSTLNNASENIYTLRNDSADKNALYSLMEQHGKNEIDFMFVDGWHSVNQVLKEWEYWEKMSPNGVMAFHDTNHHLGPVAVLDAVNTELFSVEYFGRGISDWGIAVVQRL